MGRAQLLAHQFRRQLGVELRGLGAKEAIFTDDAAKELRGILDHGERVVEPFGGAREGAVGHRQDLARTHHVLLTFIRFATKCLHRSPGRKPTESVPRRVSFRDLIVVGFPKRH
ncbi:hypothetical protein [Ponticoccus litoralis]|uniref:Uncharacterized protein n=1 Tax=Ponticoccus litoralis TaxID=422297 RepID=A0AAW9SHR4_9RHOB